MRVRSSLRIAVERHPVCFQPAMVRIRSRSWNFPATRKWTRSMIEHPVSEPVSHRFNFTAFAAANAQKQGNMMISNPSP